MFQNVIVQFTAGELLAGRLGGDGVGWSSSPRDHKVAVMTSTSLLPVITAIIGMGLRQIETRRYTGLHKHCLCTAAFPGSPADATARQHRFCVTASS